MPWSVRVAVSLGLALAPACALFPGYPDPVIEEGELCARYGDEDLDGYQDCADPSCDGAPACGESTAALCTDERDNDRDGRRDAEDLGCWPFATFELTRCESVEPAAWRGSYRAGEDGWRTIEGGTIALDPGSPDADVASLGPGGVMLGPTLTGGLDPAVLDVEVEISDTAVVQVGLMIGGADLRAVTPAGLFVMFEHGDLLVTGSNETLLPTLATVSGTRWARLVLRVDRDGDAVPTFAITLDGAPLRSPATSFLGRGVGEVPSELADGRTLVPVIRVVAGTARARVTTVSLSPIDPCGYAVPQVPATLRALVRGPDGFCGISEGDEDRGGRAHVWASSDLVELEDVGEIGGPGVDAGLFRAAGSTLLADTSGYEGIVAIVESDRAHAFARTLVRVTGARCDALVTEDLFATEVLPFPNASGISPGLENARTVGSPYRITLAQVFSGAEVSLTLAHLESDDGHRYRNAGLEEIPSRFFGDTFGGVQFLHVGGDRAMLIATDRGIDAVLERPDGSFEVLDRPVLTPSGRPGTFDELLVSSPVLALDPPAPAPARPRQTGHLAFTGAVVCSDPLDESTCALPSAVLDVEIVIAGDAAP